MQFTTIWSVPAGLYWQVCTGAHLSPRALPGMAKRTLVVGSISKSHAMTLEDTPFTMALEQLCDFATPLAT